MEFNFGEVLETNYTYNFKTEDDESLGANLFSIKVRLYDDIYDQYPAYARPLNINNKTIPLVGEHVLLIYAPNQYSSNRESGGTSNNWYYISNIALQSAISHNMLPGLSNKLTQTEIDNIEPGVTFDKTVATAPLQPYEGDTITEGRHGNRIRLGSTSNSNENRYHVQPPWVGNNNNDPIIILSNTSTRPANDANKKQLIVENVQTDDSSLYLTSTQKLSEFTLNKSLEKIKPSESDFAKSQFIGVADRVILKAKSDIIVLDSEKSVVINTDELRLGDDAATESMVYGDILARLLTDLISTIRTGTSGGGLISIFDKPTQAKFNKLTKRIQDIKSNHKIK